MTSPGRLIVVVEAHVADTCTQASRRCRSPSKPMSPGAAHLVEIEAHVADTWVGAARRRARVADT
ncbi:MAG: hypothetical protein ACPG4T_00440 [Nannocystaceae bacterium]